jgi:hypothetical protein
MTRRCGGALSITVPTTSATFEPSARRCSQRAPAAQSETLAWPQYCGVISRSVIALQTFSADARM